MGRSKAAVEAFRFLPKPLFVISILGLVQEALQEKDPNPELTYNGLWALAKPDQLFPAEDEPWEACWNDAEVWLHCWHLPGIAINIHGNVVAKFQPIKCLGVCEFEIRPPTSLTTVFGSSTRTLTPFGKYILVKYNIEPRKLICDNGVID